MALTDATRLANFSSGVGSDGTLDTNNLNISGVATAATLKVGSAITAFGGIVTATTFKGALTGNVTGNATSATTATNAEGLTGTPDITIRNITGVAATFTGVVSYEDVNNVDSVGVVTARAGLNVVGGGATVTGVSTFFDTVRVGSAITLGASSGIVTATGVNVTGIVTAASFQGSGADLTNLPASGDSNDITASLFL